MPSLKHVAASLLVGLAIAWAPVGVDAATKSSRGYSAPAAPRSAPPAYSAPTAPSAPPAARSSNGYSAPQSGASGGPSGAARAPQSASDSAISRQASGSALKSYAAQREQSRFAASGPAPSPAAPAFASYAGRYSSYDAYYASRDAYYGGFGWGAPTYVYLSRPSFGMWDAMFLWFMLDSLSNASHAAWFYNHQDDPGYQQWRQEANRLSADNADLRAKLDALDAREKALEGQPRDPNYMPPDAKTELALAPENAVATQVSGRSGPDLWLILAVLAVLACVFYAYTSRIRRVAH